MSALEEEIDKVLGPGDWRAEPLTHNKLNAVTRGIWRVGDGDRSAVLKVLSRGAGGGPGWASSEDPGHWNYWRREADVYESGLPELWRGSGLVAPELLALLHRTDGDLALWIEDIAGSPGAEWTLEEHGRLGHRLGLAQGHPVASRPWLSRSFLRSYVESRSAPYELLDDDAAWEHPVVRECFPPGLRAEMIRLHRDREWFLQLMESLPRALCHLDLWPNNVLARCGDTVLLDWAFAGDGALGEDIGNHIPDSVFDLFLPASALPALDHAVYGGYLHGLREAGWRGDERLVRQAVCASAVKYDWLVPLMLARAGDEQLDYGGDRTVPVEQRYRERGAAMMYLAGWAEEARRLSD